MAKQDNVKIITTGVLVVLLLAVFIVAFINRNEIFQKVQTIGKEESKEDRLITEPAWTASEPSTMEKGVSELKNPAVWEETERSTSTGVILPKEKSTSEETLSLPKKDPQKQGMESVPEEKEPAPVLEKNKEKAADPKQITKVEEEALPKESKMKEAKQKMRSSRKQRMKKNTRKRILQEKAKPGDASVQKRIRDLEIRWEKQNRSYDRRFIEIEDRIEKLEKQLNQ